ncbi:MAG: nucleoside-diphosphate kinase [bacterium]|nr:nucleoside-diphosphate kinase [bacterium]
MTHPSSERTLLLVKPDGVKRGLIGECIKRFEQRGYTLVGLKLLNAPKEQLRRHYSGGDEWVTSIGRRTIDDFVNYGKDPMVELGTTDHMQAGLIVIDWLIDFMSSGPIVAMVIEGNQAVEMARKILGATVPTKADIGSIRGDFSIDSPILSGVERRAIQNLMHASGTREEAQKEIPIWFNDNELCS